eukprot:scaffold228_cov312-Pinguiococcus_pyrenoidosus.AAC.68
MPPSQFLQYVIWTPSTAAMFTTAQSGEENGVGPLSQQRCGAVGDRGCARMKWAETAPAALR